MSNCIRIAHRCLQIWGFLCGAEGVRPFYSLITWLVPNFIILLILILLINYLMMHLTDTSHLTDTILSAVCAYMAVGEREREGIHVAAASCTEMKG